MASEPPDELDDIFGADEPVKVTRREPRWFTPIRTFITEARKTVAGATIILGCFSLLAVGTISSVIGAVFALREPKRNGVVWGDAWYASEKRLSEWQKVHGEYSFPGPLHRAKTRPTPRPAPPPTPGPTAGDIWAEIVSEEVAKLQEYRKSMRPLWDAEIEATRQGDQAKADLALFESWCAEADRDWKAYVAIRAHLDRLNDPDLPFDFTYPEPSTGRMLKATRRELPFAKRVVQEQVDRAASTLEQRLRQFGYKGDLAGAGESTLALIIQGKRAELSERASDAALALDEVRRQIRLNAMDTEELTQLELTEKYGPTIIATDGWGADFGRIQHATVYGDTVYSAEAQVANLTGRSWPKGSVAIINCFNAAGVLTGKRRIELPALDHIESASATLELPERTVRLELGGVLEP